MSVYPAVRLLVFVIVGVLLGTYFPGDDEYFFFVTVVSGVIVLIALVIDFRFDVKIASIVWALGYKILLVSIFAFYASEETVKVPCDTVLQYVNESVELYGTVESVPVVKGNHAQWIIDAKKVVKKKDSLSVSGKVSVKLAGVDNPKLSLLPGDNVWVTGKLQLPPIARNKGEFNYREFLAQRKIYVVITSFGEWSVEKVENREAGFLQIHFVRPVYLYLDKTIDELINGEDERAFLKGVFIGNQASISDEVKAAFQITGTIHVLSISGFHIGLLVVLLNGMMRRAKVALVGRWVTFVLAAVVLVIYSNVTGDFPPVKRAVIMSLVFSGAELLEKKSYPLNTLAVSALIILSLEPLEIFSISFILTNVAVASIILIYPKLETSLDFTKRISAKSTYSRGLLDIWSAMTKSLAMTISATIGAAPFIAYYFGTISFLGLLANIPVGFMVTLAMYLTIPMFIFNLFSTTLSGIYAVTVNELVRLSIKFIVWFSKIPFASLQLQIDLLYILCYFILVISLLGFHNKRHRGKLAILLLVSLNTMVWRFALKEENRLPKVVVNDIGQGRAIIFRTNSEAMLIDAGVRQSQWSRIEKQLKTFESYPLNAFVHLSTRDSVANKVPAAVHQSVRDSSLVLKTILTYRPTPSVLKVISKKKTLLISTKLEELNESTFYQADVIILKLRRFESEEKEKLEQYLSSNSAKRCVIELSLFVPRRERLEFYRYARTKPQIDVPARGGQILIM